MSQVAVVMPALFGQMERTHAIERAAAFSPPGCLCCVELTLVPHFMTPKQPRRCPGC